MKETEIRYKETFGSRISIDPEHYQEWCEEELDRRLRDEKKKEKDLQIFLDQVKKMNLDYTIPGLYTKIPPEQREWFLQKMKHSPKTSVLYLFIKTL